MKGWLIKFDERTPNPYFENRRFAIPNPPLVRIPYWAICEPFIREEIAQGDFLFFAPMQTFWVKGVLKVRMNATEEEAKQLLGNEWYSYHSEAVNRHSGVSRAGNVIIGELPGSFWIDGGVDIRRFAFLPKTMFNPRRQANFVPKFTNKEDVLDLYRELLDYWSSIQPSRS